jgi:hypothetical protein
LVNPDEKQKLYETERNNQTVKLRHEILVERMLVDEPKVVKHDINPKLREVNNIPAHEVVEALLPHLDEFNSEKGNLCDKTKPRHRIVQI